MAHHDEKLFGPSDQETVSEEHSLVGLLNVHSEIPSMLEKLEVSDCTIPLYLSASLASTRMQMCQLIQDLACESTYPAAAVASDGLLRGTGFLDGKLQLHIGKDLKMSQLQCARMDQISQS